jgi:hypothetical protein
MIKSRLVSSTPEEIMRAVNASARNLPPAMAFFSPPPISCTPFCEARRAAMMDYPHPPYLVAFGLTGVLR